MPPLNHASGLKRALPQRLLRRCPTSSLPFLAPRYSTSTNPPDHDVAVLGGGITGLASAYYLSQQLPKSRITIYEAGERMGGWLDSKRVEVEGGNVLFESGPRTLRTQGNGVLAGRLIQELDLASETIFTQKTAPAATSRFLYYPDQLVRMPHPSAGVLGNLYNLLGNPTLRRVPWAVVKEPFTSVPEPRAVDESVGAFFARRLGERTVSELLSGVIHGIYAGDVWKLSVKSLFPTPWRWEGQEGSIYAGFLKAQSEGGLVVQKHEGEFLKEMSQYKWDKRLRNTLKENSVFTFREGLGQLADKLYERLFATGNVEFKRSTPVDSLSLIRSESGKDTGVQITTRATQEGPSQQHTHTHVISALSPAHLNATTSLPIVPEIPTVTVMTVNLYYRSPNLHPPGFGYLIPEATPFDQNPERALGVVFDTDYSPAHTQDPSPNSITESSLVANSFRWHDPSRPLPAQDNLAPGKRGTKLTVMLGGHWWDGWPSHPSESEGLELAKSLLQRHLNISESPEAYAVNLQKDCIPQYHVGHEERLKTARANLSKLFEGRVKVAGNWVNGVGVNDCLRTAWVAAKGVKEGGKGSGLEFVGDGEMVKMMGKVNVKAS
ncbi:hypothetical protein MBLNU230_g5857t1 [Neophaeotheca triangularis]